MARVFHRFRAHAKGVFLRWEDDKAIAYIDAKGRKRIEKVQVGLKLDEDSYLPGMPIGLQFGEMTNWTRSKNGGTGHLAIEARGAIRRREIHTGHQCVSALTLARPRIHRMSLGLIVHHFGAEAALAHLRDWREGASTLQTEIDVRRNKRDMAGIFLGIDRERLRAVRNISPTVRIDGAVLKARITLPDTVMAALPGRPLTAVLDHPALTDPELAVSSVRCKDGTLLVHTDSTVELADAILALEKRGTMAPMVMAA